MNVYGIILAAGASSRMGQAKALLDFHGETFVDRLKRILGMHCRGVITMGRRGAAFADVENPWPERGMLSSLQCGLAALPDDAQGAIFTLVDLPAVESATVATLLGAARAATLVIPRFEGRRGHPVYISRSLAREFLAASATETPKTVIERHLAEGVYVDCQDRGVVRDADTPEEYREMIANG